MFRNPYADTLIVLLVVLLFLGPKRLPALGKSLGEGLREFKDSITGSSSSSEDDDDDDEDEKPRPELTAATSSPAPVAASATAPEAEVSSERSA